MSTPAAAKTVTTRKHVGRHGCSPRVVERAMVVQKAASTVRRMDRIPAKIPF